MATFERLFILVFVLSVCYWVYRSAWLDRWIKKTFVRDDRQTEYIAEEAQRIEAQRVATEKALEARQKALKKEIDAAKKIKL